MLQRVENPCTSLHDCTPSSPTTGNHYPKCDDNHSHEQSSISIIYVKLYINSITEWLSFCHLLFLLNIVKTDAGWLAWRCCWCLWPFNWPMSDLSHRYDGHFWASSDLAGTTCLCKHRSLLFPFAPPPPQSQHAMCTQNGSSKEFMSPFLRRWREEELVGLQLPVLLQVDNSRCILYAPQEIPTELSPCCPQQWPW